jgi:type II secretory pathway component PulF
MKIYRLTWIDPSGKRHRETAALSNRFSALRHSGPEGARLLSVEESRKPGRGSRIGEAFLLELTGTLLLLTESGLNLKEALEVSASVFSDQGRKLETERLIGGINRGAALHEAMRLAGFPPLYSALIRVGERIGTPDGVLRALEEHLRTRRVLREKVVSALLYPLLVLTAMLVGSLLVLLFVAPCISETLTIISSGNESFRQLSGRMRLTLLLGAGGAVATLCGAAGLFVLYRLRPSFRMRLDGCAAGTFLALPDLVNLIFALTTLTGAGVLLEEALIESAELLQNRALKAGVLSVRNEILRGVPASEAFAGAGVFPRKLVRWLALSERSGRVDRAFAGLNIYYRGEYEKLLSRLSTLVEPVLILITGLILFAAVLVFVVPLFSWYGGLL